VAGERHRYAADLGNTLAIVGIKSGYRVISMKNARMLVSGINILTILWTVFKAAAETLILPLAFNVGEQAETRILLSVI